ncbi:DNA polymerase IV [Clostridium aminobutyricum]|uniref:DNA polymerase IV n=1 Tax=Clostridium aminobutyricum TaxID=33953 RepID=A0A939D6G8_CLOAM|nr:DNA polymerase IV [Clostridium aminobutyricum]MBN7771951.1 DNA polymerase IV [Clostridium aminobutyricum]
MDRTILHCDMNSFFASVELLSHPELKHVPMAVSGSPENRHGIILAKNELAKQYGIVTAETIWSAKKKCPDLKLVPPHHEQYKRYSKLINEIYYRFTDMVEPFSIDESWLDVTASLKLFGSGKEIADTIRKTVKSELGLTLSAGVSYNKIFAKMGSEYKKPDATTVISRENYQAILWPQDVNQMFFVGTATAEKLRKTGIRTIGELAQSDKSLLRALLGKHGDMLYDYANGLDDSPVSHCYEKQKIKSVGNGITFKRNLTTMNDIQTALMALCSTVSARLRKYQMKATGVKVDIKDPYFKTISRQKQLDASTNITEEIYAAALELIAVSWSIGNPIRLLTITGINLVDENEQEQLSFFHEREEIRKKGESLDRAMDAIRSKFGGQSITFGGMINNDLGLDIHDNEESEESDSE